MGCLASRVDAKYQFTADPKAKVKAVPWIATRTSSAAAGAGESSRPPPSNASTGSRSGRSSSSRRPNPGGMSSLRSKSTRRVVPSGGGGGGGGGSRKPPHLRSLRSKTTRNLGVASVGAQSSSSRRRLSDGRGPGVKAVVGAQDGGWAGGRGTLSDATSPKEFEMLGLLGRGTLGRVFLAKNKRNGLYYAIKRISKTEICRRKNIKGVLAEIDILRACNHPFIVHLHAALQDDRFIYIVLDYAAGGELYSRMGSAFSEDSAKFYMCEIFVALKYLHHVRLTAFRDLKPENLLIDASGHVVLVDFGFAVQLNGENQEVPKACGTTQYMAPELLQKKNRSRHGLPVDWWAAGCIMFEIMTGNAPFGDIGDKSKWEIYTKVAGGAKVSFPGHVSKPARKLITMLLTVDPAKRAKWDDIRSCEWLRGVDWDAVEGRRVTPPFIPALSGPGDRSLFPERPAKKDKPDVPLSRDQLAYCDVMQPRVKP